MNIYVNSVMNAIYTNLASSSVLVNSNVTVEMNEVYNLDINRTPWVGVYDNNIDIEPWRSNITNPWKIIYHPLIYVQENQLNLDGQTRATKVNALLEAVLTAVDSDRFLRNTVDIIKGFEVNPFQLDIEAEDSIWAYEIIVNAERKG